MVALSEDDSYEIARWRYHMDSTRAGNTIRKNLFLATCLHLLDDDDAEDLDIIAADCPYGGLVGMGNSRLEKLLGRFRLFQVHAGLHDACGYMKSVYNRRPGYVYAAHCPINNSLLGHVTGLTYCAYLKYFSRGLYDSILSELWAKAVGQSSLSMLNGSDIKTKNQSLKKLQFTETYWTQ